MKKIKRLSVPKETSTVLGAIILGLLSACIVFAVMVHAETKALQAYEKGSIYIAAKEIPKGQLISLDNLEEYFRQEKVDKKMIPDTALCNPEQVSGLVPKIEIEQGTLLTSGMFHEMDMLTADMKEPVIVGIKAEDLYQVAGGILRAGDRIHIYKVDEEGITTLIWKNVYIQQVFDNVGTIISNADMVTAAQRINVYMDSKDVAQFYTELAAGSLRIVKVYE